WESPMPVTELNSEHFEGHPSLRGDGLEIVFQRDDGVQDDIYVATRKHVWQTWSVPQKIAGGVDTVDGDEFGPALSFNGKTLYFTAFVGGALGGHYDLFASTRPRVR